MQRRQFLRGAALGGAGVAAGGLATPAITQARREITVVSTWGRDFPGLGLGAQRQMRRLEEVSDGHFKVNYFAAGERVGAFDVYDDVAAGNSQAYVGADYYWKGKHEALSYFTTVPMGMVYAEHNAWIKYMGGQELWDEVGGEFGIKGLMCGSTGTQMGGWFNKEINTPDDLRGLRVRIPGQGGDALVKLGASTVSIPGGQIYENLVTGNVDAAEWVGPYNDYFLKLYEAARYYYVAGFHEPGGAIAFGMNASWWGSLNEWEKELIKAVCNEEHLEQMTENNALNGQYLTRMVNDHGVQIRYYSDELWDAFGEAMEEVFEEVRGHSPLATKVDDHWQKSLRELAAYQKIADLEFSVQRNRVLGI